MLRSVSIASVLVIYAVSHCSFIDDSLTAPSDFSFLVSLYKCAIHKQLARLRALDVYTYINIILYTVFCQGFQKGRASNFKKGIFSAVFDDQKGTNNCH